MLRRAALAFFLLADAATLPAAPDPAPDRPKSGKNFTIPQPAVAMIWITPGQFLLRATLGTGDDTHVTLTQGYWLGRTEVTQEQWQAIIDYYPVPSFFKGSDRPVEQVGWEIAMLFCARLTERERAAGRLPTGYIYTLPTEAQWEYAARAGTTGIHAGEIDALGWYDANSGGTTHPVAQKAPNPWGFHDMHGNIREWCFDLYAAYPGGHVTDPSGPAMGQFRIIRGGGYADAAGVCRTAFRMFGRPSITTRGMGFRVALAPERRPPVTDQTKSGGP